MNEIIHDNVISVILIKFRINANIQLWQSFSILNFGFGIVSDFFQYIDPWLGDEGFPTYQSWLVTPFPRRTQNPCEQYFNQLHSVAQMLSEILFGRWKNKFRILLNSSIRFSKGGTWPRQSNWSKYWQQFGTLHWLKTTQMTVTIIFEMNALQKAQFLMEMWKLTLSTILPSNIQILNWQF